MSFIMNGKFIEIHYPKRWCRPKMQNSPAKFRDAGIRRCPVQYKQLERQQAMFFHISAKHSLYSLHLFSPRQLLGHFKIQLGCHLLQVMLENNLLSGFSQCSHIYSAFSPTLDDDLQTQVVLPDTLSHSTMKTGEQDELAMTQHACSWLLCSNSPLRCRELSGCPPLACIPPHPPDFRRVHLRYETLPLPLPPMPTLAS